jgi:sporulation protein YlmC with PRC-barrel domain
MLFAGSALMGYKIYAEDGQIGSVSDLLFDDRTWRFRWLVVQTGGWTTDREVLIHPVAIETVDHDRQIVQLNLTVDRVKNSPDVYSDLPVSRQAEFTMMDYYDWDPLWGMGLYDIGMMGGYIGPPRYFGPQDLAQIGDLAERYQEGDANLRSLKTVIGYHIHATDGLIGHVENTLIDDKSWDIRYMMVDTSNWWMGKHVLISPYAVADISWSANEISLNISKESVKSSPPWDPAKLISEAEEQGLHRHYGWAGYGW